jgi:hypothetical protein
MHFSCIEWPINESPLLSAVMGFALADAWNFTCVWFNEKKRLVLNMTQIPITGVSKVGGALVQALRRKLGLIQQANGQNVSAKYRCYETSWILTNPRD